ncbi:hypothetical protein [Segniliparus rugosus]|uniref:Type VII secretion-associated protein n=1 Tax=Segniliparus rugosus (strain ATCC BAA-974 / DSM 45345 / CCUG 50838 / CIP 108380 / JCM 13579 / CDC 945) TaxID=679197 RepID=E5XKN1_SEGRC|nr:hypothetical protein [Segniliparus rugosus]EFV15078.2 hypothetical protein HMPREF9336_00050 [Segniliparus rugosus ATCC BAA-974]
MREKQHERIADGRAACPAPAEGGAVLIDLTESVVRSVHGGAVVEWPTTIGYLDPQSTDPNQIVAGEPIMRALGTNPLAGVRLLPTLVDVSHVLLNNRPHAVGDLLTRLLAPALPAKAAADDPEIVVAHPSTWGRPRAEVLRMAAAKLGARCSVLPRALALAQALAAPAARVVAVIEAQASSVDISLLTSSDGAWTQVESRRLCPQLGISLSEMGGDVAGELSDMLQEKIGKNDCSKTLDRLIVDAPPRLAEAIVAQIHQNDPGFDRIVAAPRDGALRGLAGPAARQAEAPEPKTVSQQSPIASKPTAAQPSSPPLPLPGMPAATARGDAAAPSHPQPHSPQGVPPYQPERQAPQTAQPRYGRAPYIPQQLASAEQRSPEPDLPQAGAASLASAAFSSSIEASFPEPKRSPSPAVLIGIAMTLVVVLGGGAIAWFATRSDGVAAPPAHITTDPGATTKQVEVQDPDSNGAVLFHFQLPAHWEQTNSSACPSSKPGSSEGHSFRSAPHFFHDPNDSCTEIAVSYEGIDAQATLQSVGESFRQQMDESSGHFTNLQFGVQHGANSFNSYDQPDRNASWFLYVAPHKDSKLLISIGCRNNARGAACEKALQTLKAMP